MQTGGYTLQLMCDFPDADWTVRERYEHMGSVDFPGPGNRMFTHDETGAAARAAARRAGWVLERGSQRALCPVCVKAGRVLPPTDQ